MKKNTCLALLVFLFIIFGQVRATQMPNESPISPNDALVCFVDFRIDLVVGKNEDDIADSQYCRYAIDRKKFFSLLTSVPASTFYMGNNVRAKVSISASDMYFIDYNGVVRFGGKKFQIKKMDFTKVLRKMTPRS